MKKIFILVLVSLLSACATNVKRMRPVSDLHAMDYNGISATYMERPTFLTVITSDQSKGMMFIHMDSYNTEIANESEIYYKHIDEYISYIDKYFKWEKIALSRGDAFTKIIGEDSDDVMKFTFFSGNTKSHYLELKACRGACWASQSIQYYDHAGAQKLRALLVKLKNQEFNTINVDDVYK